MASRKDIQEFLTSRRAKITPDQAGLTVIYGHRRVPGLRREEVAMLAGVSVDYYTRLERGNFNGVSEEVLESLARALQLDEAEHAHLFDLARAVSKTVKPRTRAVAQSVRPAIQRVMDSMESSAAILRNQRMDILATNRLGRALYAPVFDGISNPVNTARFCFLSPHASEFWPDYDKVTNDCVASLRAVAGRDPYDKQLTDMIGELSTRSEHFRKLWATHNVRFHRTGVKRLHHPVVGDLDLTFEALELTQDGLTLLTYTAEPATSSADGLKLLASWAATQTSVG